MKIIFFGTPPFAAQVLQDLLKAGIDVVSVVSKPDRPQGRSLTPVPTPVKVAAEAHSPPLPIHQPDIVSHPDFSPILEAYHADLFVVVAYGEIIKQHLLDMPRLGCINLHASLLPKYRGAAPIQRCIINGETESGVTIMHMVKKMDAGDIISTVKVPIGPEMTYGELEKALCVAGSEALIKSIHALEKGEASRLPQDHTQATFAPKIELEDCEIKWFQPAQNIHNLVRGVNPFPGAWCYVSVRGVKKRLKINRTRLCECQGYSPGQIVSFGREGFIVACREGAVQILELQLEGKKAMSADEFTRGLPMDQIVFI